MLVKLALEQLDAIAPIEDGVGLAVDTDALADVLSDSLKVQDLRVAIVSANYDQQSDGSPEPMTRSVKGIAWSPVETENRAHKWSFRTDGLALSTVDEGEHPAPISEDADLAERAAYAIAGQYAESVVKQSSGRVQVLLPDGQYRQVRVVVTHDPRVKRAEDVLRGVELIAYRAGKLGVAIVYLMEDGQALVRKISF